MLPVMVSFNASKVGGLFLKTFFTGGLTQVIGERHILREIIVTEKYI